MAERTTDPIRADASPKCLESGPRQGGVRLPIGYVQPVRTPPTKVGGRARDGAGCAVARLAQTSSPETTASRAWTSFLASAAVGCLLAETKGETRVTKRRRDQSSCRDRARSSPSTQAVIVTHQARASSGKAWIDPGSSCAALVGPKGFPPDVPRVEPNAGGALALCHARPRRPRLQERERVPRRRGLPERIAGFRHVSRAPVHGPDHLRRARGKDQMTWRMSFETATERDNVALARSARTKRTRTGSRRSSTPWPDVDAAELLGRDDGCRRDRRHPHRGGGGAHRALRPRTLVVVRDRAGRAAVDEAREDRRRARRPRIVTSARGWRPRSRGRSTPTTSRRAARPLYLTEHDGRAPAPAPGRRPPVASTRPCVGARVPSDAIPSRDAYDHAAAPGRLHRASAASPSGDAFAVSQARRSSTSSSPCWPTFSNRRVGPGAGGAGAAASRSTYLMR